MAGSLEEVGAGPGGDAVRRFLAQTFNDDGSTVGSNVVADTYSASITPDAAAGSFHTIAVTNNTAFTINNPTNPPASNRTAELVVEVANGAGGAMGAITWDTAFVFPAGTSWTNPANTKKRFGIFRWNGASWVCVRVSGGDY